MIKANYETRPCISINIIFPLRVHRNIQPCPSPPQPSYLRTSETGTQVASKVIRGQIRGNAASRIGLDLQPLCSPARLLLLLKQTLFRFST